MLKSTVILFGLAGLLSLAPPAAADDQGPAPPPGQQPPARPPRPAVPPEAAALADWLEKSYAGTTPPEGVRMLVAIARGSQMGPGDGWFGPAQTRYTWAWLAQRHGIDPAAGAITKDKFHGPPELFDRLDRNKDGRIRADDLDWSDRNPYVQQANMVNRLFRRMDPSGSGKLTREQWQAFFDKARQGKEHLTGDDLRDALLAGVSSSFQPGDAPDPATLVRGLFAGEIGSIHEGPQVGQPAPNFVLKRVDGQGSVELSTLVGPKPVVLVFGNFTCGPFRSLYPAVDDVYQRHKDRANFLMVYVREAHPQDGWHMESNARVGVALRQPTSFDERVDAANQFCRKLNPNLPVVVDEINDPVGHAYSGMPARLYVIDTRGKVAYKSGRGPFGFKPGEMEQALVMALLEGVSVGKAPARAAAPPGDPAWVKLPEAEEGAGGPLPGWAQALAAALPRTTASMLEMDRLYRTRGVADGKLRAMARWAAARANQCPYGEAYALADLRRAGATDEEINILRGDWSRFPEDTRRVLQFADKLTRAAYSVTDEEVARLKTDLGEPQLVALVQLLAYANFQDRLALSLGLSVEPGGPLPPSAVRFRRPWVGGEAPERKLPAVVAEPEAGIELTDGHRPADFHGLKQQMESQRGRRPRVSVPAYDDVKPFLPNRPNAQPLRINWSLVCVGHSPELANAWLNTMRTYASEAKQDRVFEELLFWVVTRSLQCFY